MTFVLRSHRFVFVASAFVAACGSPSAGADVVDGCSSNCDASAFDAFDAPGNRDAFDISPPRDAIDGSPSDTVEAAIHDAAPADARASDAPDAATSGITVAGARLLRDGADFYPHGFNMVGVATPDACTTAPAAPIQARAAFGTTELTAARDAWHANTVRFQVSQRGLDPTDALYSRAYVTRVHDDVALARSLGLVVIVSMQDQSYACGPAQALPTAATQRAWATVVPLLRNDPYVLFELFNEPQSGTTAADWAEWKDGGTSPIALGVPAVGHQAIVDAIRAMGATNVLVADGANYAELLTGLPMLTDTLNPPQIAYATHPYYFNIATTLATDESDWDRRFAYLASTAPVIATEWNVSQSSCTASEGTLIPQFFSYLQSHHIGVLGHAFDVVGTMVTNLTTWPPTTFTGCSAGSNGGQDLQSFFATLP